MAGTAGGGNAALIAADTYFESGYLDKVLEGPDSQLVGLLSEDMNEVAQAVQLDVTMGDPALRLWRGSKQERMLRQLASIIKNEPYEKTIGIDAVAVKTNRTGSIMRAINRMFGRINYDLEVLIFNAIMGNTAIGADGVPLLSDAHPYSNSTGDNLLTDDLGFSVYDAVRALFAGFQDEDGKDLDMFPTHLFVPIGLTKTAREIASADRIVAINNTGVEAATGVIAGVARTNVYQGELTVVSTTRLKGKQYLFADLSKGVKPIVRAVAEELHPVKLDREEDVPRFINNKYMYSVEGIMGFGPGPWQTVVGRTAAS